MWHPEFRLGGRISSVHFAERTAILEPEVTCAIRRSFTCSVRNLNWETGPVSSAGAGISKYSPSWNVSLISSSLCGEALILIAWHLEVIEYKDESGRQRARYYQSATPRPLRMTATSPSLGQRKVPSSSMQHCSKHSVLAQSLGMK
jgi:hypothetical protein